MTKEEFIKLDDAVSKYYTLSKWISGNERDAEKLEKCINDDLRSEITIRIDSIGSISIDDFYPYKSDEMVEVKNNIIGMVFEACKKQIEKLKKEMDELSVD